MTTTKRNPFEDLYGHLITEALSEQDKKASASKETTETQTRMTREIARGIWKAACNTKCVLQPFELHERLQALAANLDKAIGADTSLPIGQFLSGDGVDHGSNVGGLQQHPHSVNLASRLPTEISLTLRVQAGRDVEQHLGTIFNQLTLLLGAHTRKLKDSALQGGSDDLSSGV
jgi:hypothetical protein